MIGIDNSTAATAGSGARGPSELNFTAIEHLISASFLDIFAALHPISSDPTPPDCKTLLLLGPREPGFWPHVSAQPEFSDGNDDPLDRWSKRVVDKLASLLSARAAYPSDGPPYPPFVSWALQSGWVETSPVGLLVHPRAGLFVSFRAALLLEAHINLPDIPESPCATCNTQPCRHACPVNALSGTGYDVAACHGFLNQPDGQDCMTRGCKARRACPTSRQYGRLDEQSAFHMEAFHPS